MPRAWQEVGAPPIFIGRMEGRMKGGNKGIQIKIPVETVWRNLARVARKPKPCHKTHLTLNTESHWGLIGSIQIKKKEKCKCLEKKIGLKLNWLEHNPSCVAWLIHLTSPLLHILSQRMVTLMPPSQSGGENEWGGMQEVLPWEGWGSRLEGDKMKGTLCRSQKEEDFWLP